jgi:hypothetical protein
MSSSSTLNNTQSQKLIGGDMSVILISRLPHLNRFASPEQQQIKGLNFETIATICFPPPAWLYNSEYTSLQPLTDGENAYSALFSLNMSIYDQSNNPANSPDWDDTYFILYGLMHPYALTWEISSNHDSATSHDLQNYTIPSLIVRDLCYQPIAPRMFNAVDGFPTMSPIVTFTGLIVGSGLTLLHNDPESGLSETQQKCCGFAQLSTFITPGNPAKPPFRGSHQFQVFIIFPIHTNPWVSRCKKMAERQSTQFHPHTIFNCTGRVAGLLNHNIMVHPPPLSQDYVLIIVPDSWSFQTSPRDSLTTSPPTAISSNKSASDPRAQFISPSKPTKRKLDHLEELPTPKTPTRSGTGSTMSSSHSPNSPSTSSTSTTHISPQLKLQQPDYIQPASPIRAPSSSTLDSSSKTISSNQLTNPIHTTNGTQLQSVQVTDLPPANLVPYSTPQPPNLSYDPPNRPHRNRQPPKKD